MAAGDETTTTLEDYGLQARDVSTVTKVTATQNATSNDAYGARQIATDRAVTKQQVRLSQDVTDQVAKVTLRQSAIEEHGRKMRSTPRNSEFLL